MDISKDSRKKEHTDDESCSFSNESWQYDGNMCCPYMNACPLMFQMTQYGQVKVNRDEDDIEDETDMRNPEHGHHDDHGHDHDHHYYPYPYYGYPYYGYPYYGYPYYGYPYYGYPYHHRPRPW